MNRQADNTSLWQLVEGPQAGLWLSLRKGLNELLHTRRCRPAPPVPYPARRYIQDAVSVILCTYRRPEAALCALQSLLRQTLPQQQYEILVVDNAPGDRSFRSRIEARWRQSGAFVGYLEEPRTGISYARNTGAQHASGSYLLFIDDDAVADRYLLALLQDAFRRHPEAGVIGGQVFLEVPSPRPQIFTPAAAHLWSGYTVSGRQYRTVTQPFAMPYGACLGVRHTAFDAAGGFSTAYGRHGGDYAGGEETQLCLSVMQCGYTVGILPAAQVVHRVAPERFSEEHVRRTVQAGLTTAMRLSRDGYLKTRWTDTYLKTRIHIAERELRRLRRKGAHPAAVFQKECERDALAALRDSAAREGA